MRILTFYDEDEALRLGVVRGQDVVDVAKAAEALGVADAPATPSEFYETGSPAVAVLAALLEKVDDADAQYTRYAKTLALGPVTPSPGKILCVGLNYRSHAEESAMDIPQEPVLFSKFNNALAAHGQTVQLPSLAREYDYEAELALVIGRRAKDVPTAEALDYVLGYCNANDLSARDLQFRTGQWLVGKTLDGFLPVGPYLVTADEVVDPQNLNIRCWRNGKLVQDSNTADMIFSVKEIIAHASRLMTLEPGDLIITGTPQGVVFGAAEKNWLRAGEEVVVEVQGLGQLRNTFSQS